MSVHVLSWVLKHSPATQGARLVLIVLADHASHDGTDAYPSVKTLAHQARLSERATQYALRELENLGCITRAGFGPSGTSNYTVNTDLGKFDELDPLNSNLPFSREVVGSMDGSGAVGCTPSPQRLHPVQNLHPPLKAVENG